MSCLFLGNITSLRLLETQVFALSLNFDTNISHPILEISLKNNMLAMQFFGVCLKNGLAYCFSEITFSTLESFVL